MGLGGSNGEDIETAINSIVRTINQALIGASTENEILEVVCKIFSNSDMYTFAWIGDKQPKNDEVRVLASEGIDETYLDNVFKTVTEGEPTGEGPTGSAFRTKRIQTAQNIPDNTDYEPRRKEALKHGYNSTAAVPISYQDDFRGVLNLYTGRTNAFEDNEKIVLSELGATIWFAINYVNIYDQMEVLNRILRHDIRNYANVISGRGELVKEHVNQEGGKHLEKLLQVTDNIVQLTEHSRELAEATSNFSLQLERIELIQTVRSEIESFRQVEEKCNVSLSVECDADEVYVEANQMLSSLIRNLLDNAVKHNDKQNPCVNTKIETVDRHTARIEVADNGVGIPDDQKEDILAFGMKGSKSSGTGIGLYLVKTLVDQYNGDIWVEDNQPEGTVFSVHLQRHKEE